MDIQVFASTAGHALGRVYLLHCDGPLGGPEPEVLLHEAIGGGARVVIIDAMQSSYADSDGLRWLLRLGSAAAEQNVCLRLAAPEGGNIWRNVTLLRSGFLLYPSVQSAWSAPYPPNLTQMRKENGYGGFVS